MGILFGRIPDNAFNLYFNPDLTPHPLKVPANDPLDGFDDDERQERPINFTKEECESAKIDLRHRDYCGYYLLKFRACRKNVWPFVVLCEHEKHAYLDCQYEDYIHRMKEYEREKRMMKNAVCTCDDDDDECEENCINEEDEDCEDEEVVEEECDETEVVVDEDSEEENESADVKSMSN